MIKNDLLLLILAFEWWLGCQKWITPKSIVALFILIVTLGYFALCSILSRRKEDETK